MTSRIGYVESRQLFEKNPFLHSILKKMIIALSSFIFVLNLFGQPNKAFCSDENQAFNEHKHSLKIGQKAEQLIQNKKSKEAIALLKPYIHRSYSLMYYYFQAHRLSGLKPFVEDVKPLADSNNPFAAYFLAYAYQTSIAHLAPDYDIIKYYKLALQYGVIFGAELIAIIYYSGQYRVTGDFHPTLQDYSKAKQYYQTCLNSDKDNQRFNIGFGHTLMRLGKTKEGLKYLEEAKSYSTLWALYYFGYSGVKKDISKANMYLDKMTKYKELEPGKIHFHGSAILAWYQDFIKGEVGTLTSIAILFSDKTPSGVIGNNKLYVELLRKAADKGSYEAAFYVGEL